MNVTRKTLYSKNKTKRRRRDRMNCAPLPKSSVRPVDDSCYTADALLKLRSAYNQKHPGTPILSKNPKIIWNYLKNNLHDCETEDCWLKQISDTKTRKQLDEISFFPTNLRNGRIIPMNGCPILTFWPFYKSMNVLIHTSNC